MKVPLLLIDAGNTRVKWATAHREGNIVSAGEFYTPKTTAVMIRKLAKEYAKHRVVLSSVVPRLRPYFERAFKDRLQHVEGGSPLLGLTYDYYNPKEIGTDRLASAVAAHAEGQWPAIVVNCGTATAFTVIDAQGRLCGGAIAPGLHGLQRGLIESAAQLNALVLTLTTPQRASGRSTREAIRAGVVYMYQGGVKEILRQLQDELPKDRPARVLLTGGDAPDLAKALGLEDSLRPLLVFEGLRIIGLRTFTDS